MSSIFTHVRKPVSDTSNEPGLPVIEIQRVTAKASTVTRHQYGISALFPQRSFRGETKVKCRLFSQANSN